MTRLLGAGMLALAVSAAATSERAPAALDVSVILDVSGSVTGPLEDNLVALQQQIPSALASSDRRELITVDREIRRAVGPREWTIEMPPRIADGGTRLFDALLTVALERETAGRRHVIVVLTDGLDTGSLFDRATRVAVLRRAHAIVDLVAISIGGRRSGFMSRFEPKVELGDYDYLLREITDVTGGRFYDMRPGDSLIDSLQADLDRARSSGH